MLASANTVVASGGSLVVSRSRGLRERPVMSIMIIVIVIIIVIIIVISLVIIIINTFAWVVQGKYW